MATKKLTDKQIDKVCAFAQKAGVPDGFDPLSVKDVRSFRKEKKDAIKIAEREIDALDKILAIIAPPKAE